MKHSLTFILALCCHLMCGAQATSLTIDNQTPGWLSSKINYGDQLTVKNLTLTGYLNGTDFNFILELANRRSLDGVLDLSEAYIVGGGDKVEAATIYDDTWSILMCNPKKPLQKVILPKSLKPRYTSGGNDCTAKADTIIIPTPFANKLNLYTMERNPAPFYSIPEGVEQLDQISYTKVLLPKSIKKIDSHTQQAVLYAPWENPSVEAIYYVYTSTGGIYYYPTGVIYVPNGSKEKYHSSDFKQMEIREYGDIELAFSAKTKNVYVDDLIPLDYTITGWRDEIGWIDAKSDNDGMEIDLKANQVTFKKAGQYNVTLTPCTVVPYFNTIGGSCQFNVLEHVTSVEIPENLSLGIGETVKLSAVVQPEGKTNDEVTWMSTDNSIATVDNDGLVKAKAIGNCKIIATSVDGGHKGECDVTVVQPVESVVVSSKEISLKVGDSEQLTATVLPANAYDKSIIWESSAVSIATVSENGKVTAIGPGSAIISAVSNYNHEIKDLCQVIVIQPATGITLEKTELEIEEDESAKLQATVLPTNASNQGVNWTSSDVSIAMVSPDGTVYAIKSGKATIMATTVDGGYAALCKVTVKPKTVIATDLNLSMQSSSIKVGETLQLTATLSPDNVSNKTIDWSSTDENIATVDASGLVKALAEGKAKIIASTTDGSNLSAECNIEVEGDAGVESILADNKANVRIYNITGCLVYEGIYSDAKLKPGIYVVYSQGKVAKVMIGKSQNIK